MGLIRVASRSVISVTRSKRRLLVFLTIFTILASATLVMVSVFEEYNQENLLDQKGLVITMAGFGTVQYSQAEALENVIEDDAEGSFERGIIFPYFDVGTELRVLCIYANHPWCFAKLKPTDIKTGRFLRKSYEALIPHGAYGLLGGLNLTLDVGLTIHAGTEPNILDFPIVGTFPNENLQDVPTGRQWLVIGIKSSDDLSNILDTFGIDPVTDLYVYAMTIMAKGSPVGIYPWDWFSAPVYKNVDTLFEVIDDNYGDSASYGDWVQNVDYTPASQKTTKRTSDVTTFIFGIGGGILVATLYAYLITRFRRREVAILKAIGYGKKEVRTALLSEILSVALGGFTVGYAIVMTGRWVLGDNLELLSWFTTSLSLAVVVLVNIPGFLLVSWKILAVRPIELFRAR
ncbi:MAG: FtsX-like permease family protein [Promethearchaeota archaeon]